MYKVKIFTIGKMNQPYLVSAIEDYTKRLKPQMSIEWIFAKNDRHLCTLLEKETHYISLDPTGTLYTSVQLSKYLHEQLLKRGSRLSFVIGGAEGLPSSIKAQSGSLLSLSPLTFTHSLAWLIFLEQLYRSVEIEKGSPYNK